MRQDSEHCGQRRGDEMPEWVANKQQRLAKIREAKAALEAEARAAENNGLADGGDACGPAGEAATTLAKPADKAQRNFTDAESRIMKTKDGFIRSSAKSSRRAASASSCCAAWPRREPSGRCSAPCIICSSWSPSAGACNF